MESHLGPLCGAETQIGDGGGTPHGGAGGRGKSSTGLAELQVVLSLQGAEGASVQPAWCSWKGGLDPLGGARWRFHPMQRSMIYVPGIKFRTQSLHLHRILHYCHPSGADTSTQFTDEETEALRLNTSPRSLDQSSGTTGSVYLMLWNSKGCSICWGALGKAKTSHGHSEPPMSWSHSTVPSTRLFCSILGTTLGLVPSSQWHPWRNKGGGKLQNQNFNPLTYTPQIQGFSL